MSEPANYVKFSYKEYLTYFLKIRFPPDYLYLMDWHKWIYCFNNEAVVS